jgi:predicted dehydrogenase
MLRFAAIGLDHRHIYHMVAELIAAGAQCAGYCPLTSDPRVLAGFRERFPDVPPADRERLLDDPAIDIVCCAAIPRDRAGIAIRAMTNGKDVMVDKPGLTTPGQLAEVVACVARTGRIFSICFSERFIVRASEIAAKLVAEGAIGEVVNTVGLGPHRLNRAIRPAWFFERPAHGGILVDIASHQIDQFLFYTGAATAQIVASSTANHAVPDMPDFSDFGEILLRSAKATGYIRVDWFTPDSLPSWGDGRLTLLGTKGFIELRKYLDIAGRAGTDHVFLSNHAGTRHIDASSEPLTYFSRFLADVRDRTQTAASQAHVLAVSSLSLDAEAAAVRLTSTRNV